MLDHLHISNYALIDRLEVDLSAGLNIITGETGSGKSILLGALALAMGERADSKVLLDKKRKCIVELQLDLAGLQLEELFQAYDLDYEQRSIFRRQIEPQGRSRAFVNDTPVRLEILKNIASRVVHIHSQHQNALITSKAFQFDLLDHLAAMSSEAYKNCYREWLGLKDELLELQEQERQATLDEDYHRFQLNELKQAQLRGGEQRELEERLATLEHAEQLHELAQMAESGEALRLLQEIQERLGRAAGLNQSLGELNERFSSAYLELKDLFADVGRVAGEAGADPLEQEALVKRMDLLNGLMHKHRLGQVEQLIELQKSLEAKLSGLETQEQELKELKERLASTEIELAKHAAALQQARLNSAKKVANSITGQLRQLGMPAAQFLIELSPNETYGPYGKDELTFSFSANKGVGPQDLRKVASGGELSRIMLVLISLLADAKGLPSVIFDEIDTGVSGDIAARVGQMMKAMAKHMQVLCITHLPQIAGKADVHFKVLREESAERTNTILKELDEQARLQELAQMLSGTKVGPAALENAKTLMS